MDLILYIIFAITVSLFYWNTNFKYRKILLCIINIAFYFYFARVNVFVLIYVIIVSYMSGLFLQNNKKPILLIASIISCLLPLACIKYGIFTINRISSVIGLSYYSLQAVSYIIDVYNGMSSEKNIINYICYISFFSTVTCGPIERYKHFNKQISEKKEFNTNTYTKGLIIIGWGLFSKSIADFISIYINDVFNNVYNYAGLSILLSIIMYAVQIYCDFSGYSKIAKGVSSLLGIDIIDNFNVPYFSTTIKEFWSKWHISLSTWLRDYVYIPLGGNRCGKIKHLLNLFITFIVSGIWHGTNITFIIWGAIHGLLQIIENVLHIKKENDKYSAKWWIRCCLLFCVLCITWIFFRANSIQEAVYMLNPSNILYGINKGLYHYIKHGLKEINLTNVFEILELFISMIVFVAIEYASTKYDVISSINKKNKFVRYTIYVGFIILILLIIPIENKSEFVYFKF